MDSSADWLLQVWGSLPQRSRDILARRRANQTLDQIGRAHHVSRERARQLIDTAGSELLREAYSVHQDSIGRVRELLDTASAVADHDLARFLPDPVGIARYALLSALAFEHPSTWMGNLREFWTAKPTALDEQLKELADHAPCTPDELLANAALLGIPNTVPVELIMSADRSPLAKAETGAWVRRRTPGRDAAFLWLAERGEPRPAVEVAEAIGTNPRAIAEALRRDERFRQIRPEGTWALAGWPLPGVSKHTNALDVTVEVLTELGPLTKRTLFAEVQKRYPVSYARMQQCLISDKIGTIQGGLLDLVERGAYPIEETEPRRPNTVAVDGQVLGFRLPVTKDLQRGSGIIINPWITWYLGLRLAPMSRTFSSDQYGEVTIRRGTGGAQISSLRSPAQAMGLALGCELAIVLHLDDDSASIRHACSSANCPMIFAMTE